MKKTIYYLLFCALIFLLNAPALAADNSENGDVIIAGELYKPGISEEEQSRGMADTRITEGLTENERQMVYFDSLTSMLAALNAGRIDTADLPKCTAEYLAAQNSHYEPVYTFADNKLTLKTSFRIGVMEGRSDLLNNLNSAIAALAEKGILDELKTTYIDDLLEGKEPPPVPPLVITDTPTVRVVVTGDLPPLDYVSADGKAAGYNIALLTALSDVMNVNFELVLSDAGSRAAMLTSGKADAVFWMRNTDSFDSDGKLLKSYDETPEGIVLTDPYFADDQIHVVLK